MVARQNLLIQQVTVSARWELMREQLEKRVEHWNPEEPILIPVRGDRPEIGGFYSGCNSEVYCRVAIFGGAFFLNDSSLFLFFETLVFAESLSF